MAITVSCFSKILERIMYNQVYNYILVVFIDSSKAFDAVDDNILIDKLNSYGIKSNSLKWFSSYLSNRKQFIQAGAIKTEYTFLHKARGKDNIPLLYSFIYK